VEGGCVFRVPKSYPVYDSGYRQSLSTLRNFVESLENFQTIGRNGLHRYNNQDHAMLTGMLAVRNVVFGEHNDLWSVNTDQEYIEEIREPAVDLADTVETILERVFLKLDRIAFGVSLGTVSGLLVFLATLILVIKGGDVVGPNLRLLSEYFPGYEVTASGSAVGLVYGFLTGFISGWSFAFLRNTTMFLYKAAIHRRAELYVLRQLFEYF
jgi:hypothetical protein